MNATQRTTVVSWYLGELGGEAMFLVLATRSADRSRARKWQTLAMLEHETARRIAEVLASGGAPLPTDDAGADAEARIAELSGRSWKDQMIWLRDIAEDALEEMTREAAEFPFEMRRLVEFVLAHERALMEFATRELAGDEDNSLDAVRRLLEMGGR